MKSKEELMKLKTEYKKFNEMFSELSKDELKEVVGGSKTTCSFKDDPSYTKCPFSEEYIWFMMHDPQCICGYCNKNYLYDDKKYKEDG